RWMHGEPLEPRDPGAAVLHLEAHGPGPLAVRFDHEPPELAGLGLGSLDLLQQAVPVERRAAAEEGLHVVVVDELVEKVEVAAPRAADHDHGVSPTGARRGVRTVPVPRATPARMSASPPRAEAVTGSSRKTAP